jgi:hypothetical protein
VAVTLYDLINTIVLIIVIIVFVLENAEMTTIEPAKLLIFVFFDTFWVVGSTREGDRGKLVSLSVKHGVTLRRVSIVKILHRVVVVHIFVFLV